MDKIERNIRINLERLNRQYQINLNVYDEISLLDLSHILRLWVDMKDEVQKFLNDHNLIILFPSYTLNKQFKRYILRYKHTVLAIPGRVETYPSDTKDLISAPINKYVIPIINLKSTNKQTNAYSLRCHYL